MKWILITTVSLALIFLGARSYYNLVTNPNVIEEVQSNPTGERANIVTVLTFEDGSRIPVNYLREGQRVYLGADGSWWREFQNGGARVELLIEGETLQGHAVVILDDPQYTKDVFSRLRPKAPEWLPAWLNGKLIEITLLPTAMPSGE